MSKRILLVTVCVAVIFGGIGYAIGSTLKSSMFSVQTNAPSTNVNGPTSEDPWWWGVGTFQKNQYSVTACEFTLEIPKGIYMQQESYNPGKAGESTLLDARSCYAKFGDDGKYWDLDVQSYSAPTKPDLRTWLNTYTKFDITFQSREFGTNKALYGESTLTNFSDDDYRHMAIVQTGDWIFIITYHDKDSGLPRQEKFETLVASIKAYTGESATPAPKYILTARKVVNSSTDLYTSGEVRFSIELPHAWFVRTFKDANRDVHYDGLMASIESSPNPLFWSSGKGPDNESSVSLSGIAMKIFREPYFNAKFSDYLDTHYQKGIYQTKKVTLGKDLSATLVWSNMDVQVYNQEYIIVSGDYVYTIGIRQENTKDDTTINTMLKSLKLL